MPIFSFTGADTLRNYQSILGQIFYYNRKPAYYLNRAFKLTCSELNGRFVSNDYIQTLTVIHPKVDLSTSQRHDINLGHQSPVAHVQIHEHEVDFKNPHSKTFSALIPSGILDGNGSYARTSASKYRFKLPNYTICLYTLIF